MVVRSPVAPDEPTLLSVRVLAHAARRGQKHVCHPLAICYSMRRLFLTGQVQDMRSDAGCGHRYALSVASSRWLPIRYRGRARGAVARALAAGGAAAGRLLVSPSAFLRNTVVSIRLIGFPPFSLVSFLPCR